MNACSNEQIKDTCKIKLCITNIVVDACPVFNFIKQNNQINQKPF